MPAYIDQVKEAISALKTRGGSSLAAIKKYTEANHNLDFTKGSDKSHLVSVFAIILCLCLVAQRHLRPRHPGNAAPCPSFACPVSPSTPCIFDACTPGPDAPRAFFCGQKEPLHLQNSCEYPFRRGGGISASHDA
jgi:hypothetical protein